MKKEKNCSDIKKIITDFVYDKNISSENRDIFFKHIKECPDCEKFYQLSSFIKNNISATSSFFEPENKALLENRKIILSKIEKKETLSLFKMDFLQNIGFKPVYANILIFVFLFGFSMVLFQHDNNESNISKIENFTITPEKQICKSFDTKIPQKPVLQTSNKKIITKKNSYSNLKTVEPESKILFTKKNFQKNSGITKKIILSKNKIEIAKTRLKKKKNKFFSADALVAIKPSARYTSNNINENAALLLSDSFDSNIVENSLASNEKKENSFGEISSGGVSKKRMSIFNKYKTDTYSIKIISKKVDSTAKYVEKILKNMKIENKMQKNEKTVIFNGTISKNQINELKKQILFNKNINLSIFPKNSTSNSKVPISLKLSIKISQ